MGGRVNKETRERAYKTTRGGAKAIPLVNLYLPPRLTIS